MPGSTAQAVGVLQSIQIGDPGMGDSSLQRLIGKGLELFAVAEDHGEDRQHRGHEEPGGPEFRMDGDAGDGTGGQQLLKAVVVFDEDHTEEHGEIIHPAKIEAVQSKLPDLLSDAPAEGLAQLDGQQDLFQIPDAQAADGGDGSGGDQLD